MESLEAADTNFGKFVPMHLLKFDGDLNLQSSFRSLIENNYGRGIVKPFGGVCEKCNRQLSNRDKVRMRPSQANTKRISKLLKKHKSGCLFGKYNTFVLNRFMRSCTQLVVPCPKCQHVNRQDLVSNEMKVIIKENLLEHAFPVIPQESESLSASQKKKRRKKRKRKSEEMDQCGLIIPNAKTPLGQRQGQEKPSPLIQKRQSKNVEKDSKGHTPWLGQALQQKVTLQSKFNPITPKTASTPQSMNKGKTITFNTPATVKKSVLKQKDLKQFLKEGQTQADSKRASLSDFLSSL